MRFKKFISHMAAISLVIYSMVPGMAVGQEEVLLEEENQNGNITICHYGDDGYEKISPNANGVLNGHAKNHELDIIPPFDHEDGSFEGMNWNSENEILFNNDCVEENGEEETRSLTVTKEVINDDEGTAVVSDFTLFVGATEVDSGEANDFVFGQYTISESGGPSGYTSSFSGDCDSQGNITIGEESDASLECTITNDDNEPLEEQDSRVHVRKFICEPGTEITSAMVPDDNGGYTMPDECELAKGQQTGQQVGTIFEAGKTENTGPYPTNFADAGDIDVFGELHLTFEGQGRVDIAEGDGSGNFGSDPEGFMGIACNDDEGSHTDNYEIALVNPGETDFCNIFNEGDVAEEPNGLLVISKYVCDEGTEFNSAMTPDNTGAAIIPAGCELASEGFDIGAVFEEGNTTGNPPFPTAEDFTLLGTTDSSGELAIDIPSGGRHFLAEGDGAGNFPDVLEGLIGFACEDDAGTHINNFEAVFMEDNGVEYCNVYNVEDGDVGGEVDTQLHFIKVICDTFEGVEGSEPINPDEIPENCDRAQGWEFALSTDEAQADPEIIGPTGVNGEFTINVSGLPLELKNAVEAGNQLWVSEESQDEVATFGALRCYTDVVNDDNLEFIQLDPQNMPEHAYCIAYNESVEDMGRVVINKYVCVEGTEFDTSANSSAMPDAEGNAVIPEGCEPADGFQFGYIHEPNKTDLSPPYPGLDDDTPFTAIAGETGDNGPGKLVLTDLPTGGRLDLTEIDGNDSVIAFMCNEDTGIADNNYEVVFNESDKVSYCNVFNEEGDVGGEVDTRLHFIKVICDTFEGVEGSEPINPDEIPQDCDRTAGWNFALSTDSEQVSPEIIGPTGVNGEFTINASGLPQDLRDALETGAQLWVSEEEQDSVATFGALRCSTDAVNDDNLEFIQLDPNNMPEDVYCIAYNDSVEEVATLVINKYICTDNAVLNTTADSPAMPDDEGNATIPEGCELANGFQFGYIHEPAKADLSPPYPGLDDNTPFTAIAGQTGDDGTGRLVVTGLPTGGRLDLTELNGDNRVIAFMCNEDTGIADNNYEVVFNELNQTSYCNVFNSEEGDVGGEEGTTLHLIKVTCQTQEEIDAITATTPIGTAEIPDECDRASGWNFNLSLDQAQTDPTLFGPTNTSGEVTINMADLSDEFAEALEGGEQIWVSEESQDEIATFGDLRCHTDAAGNDNLDFIQLDSEDLPDDVFCIAYNVDVDAGTDIHLMKVICDSFDGVEGTEPIGTTEIPENCDPAEGWEFALSLDQAQAAPTIFGPTNSSGEVLINITDIGTDFQTALEEGDQVWVSEVGQDEVATFGALRCHTDAGNTDNLEFIQLDSENLPDDVFCIAYNVAVDNGDGGSNGGGGGGGGSSTRRISGVKYNDVNGNGTQDSGEPELEGWVIYLDENGNNVWDDDEEARTTDEDGEYRFSGISSDTYTVREVNQDGWTQTEPGVGDDFEYTVEISSDNRVEDGLDFGNIFGSVGGVNIDFPSNNDSGDVLGESINLGGGESLPVTGLKASVLILLVLLGIGLALTTPSKFMRRV